MAEGQATDQQFLQACDVAKKLPPGILHKFIFLVFEEEEKKAKQALRNALDMADICQYWRPMDVTDEELLSKKMEEIPNELKKTYCKAVHLAKAEQEYEEF